MKIFEEWDIRLPSNLSESAAKRLFEDIKDFPDNLHKVYRVAEEQFLLQGDGVKGLPIIHLPDPRIERYPVLVISNTCDTDPANPSDVPPRIMYCPIIKLETYKTYLESRSVNQGKITEHFNLICSQRITTKFYLPVGSGLQEESVALLDHINNCATSELPSEETQDRRIFSLDLYGWYVLLIKLSIHFTRVREGLHRGFV